MAFVWRININPNPGGPATFEFDDQPPPTVQVGDQIIWSNEDVQPHFPHPNAVGTFMPNQIAPNSRSPAFALSTPRTLDEAFKLVELISSYQVAQEVQRVTQYYPCPPVASTLPKADTLPTRRDIRQRNSVTPHRGWM